MTQELVTVVTATLGDSYKHLRRQLEELRRFTKLPFRQIVSDDGSSDRNDIMRQQGVCDEFGAEWTENPGTVFGVSYNLNWLCEQVKTPWAFVIEDAVRPSMGWLETAMDALYKVGQREWCGHKIGAIGLTSSFEAWHLACASVMPAELSINDYFDKHTRDIYDIFYGSEFHNGDWNDGYWCWQRMHAKALERCQTPEGDTWPEIIRRTWRDPILRGEVGSMQWQKKQYDWGWQALGGWPTTRTVSWAFGSSAWCLVNLEAWRNVGRWRDGCTFYEGHLGVRMAQKGYLTVNCECPPWLHMSSLAFHIKDHQRGPRHHEPPDGPNGLLKRDFGCDGQDHVDLADLARRQFKDGELDEIGRQLADIKLYMDPGWEKWER